MISNNNDVVKSITRFKLFSPSLAVLAENISYININFLIQTFIQILGNILSEMELSVTKDPIKQSVK